MDEALYFHEQRNLLTNMIYLIDEARETTDQASRDKIFDGQVSIVDQMLNMQDMYQTLGGQLNRRNQYTTTRIDLLLKNMADVLSARLGARISVQSKSCVLCTDVEKLQIVVENLVGNAVKYSDKQPVMIHVERFADRSIEMRVIDRGIGIPEADIVRIGEPLFRTARSKDVATGTGLGIYFSKKLLDQLGFSLSFTSSAAGTCATIHV